MLYIYYIRAGNPLNGIPTGLRENPADTLGYLADLGYYIYIYIYISWFICPGIGYINILAQYRYNMI